MKNRDGLVKWTNPDGTLGETVEEESSLPL